MTSRHGASRTLDELEGVRHAASDYDSYLMATCNRLRSKPIGEFTVEDLRLMIGQGIGTRYLVPLALDVLERDPLAMGDYYPGDLLQSVLTLDPATWAQEPGWRARLGGIVEALAVAPAEVQASISALRRSVGRERS